MWVIDAKTYRFLDVNGAAVAKYGYSRKQFLKMRATDIRPAADVERFKRYLAEERHGLIRAGRWRHVLKSGETIYVDIVAHRLKVGSRQAFLAAMTDVTEIHKAEERAQYLFRQQVAAMQASMDGMAVLDAEGRYIYLNEAHAHVYGYDSPQDLVGKSWKTLYDPKELSRFETHIMPEFFKKGHWRGEAVGKRRDGSLFPQEISLSAIEGGGLVCVVSDIRARKSVEEERERLLQFEKVARADAEQAARSKDEFLALVSHELRTPMTATLGWLWLLREGSLDAEGNSRAIDTIERNMKQQAQIIEDLLDVSKITSGKMYLHMRPIEFGSVLREAMNVARPSLEAKSIQSAVETAPTELFVMGDPDRLQQAVWNLLSNAIKFTSPRGRVGVRLASAGSRLELAVEDSGQGISPEFLPYLFDRFRQGENPITRSQRGLGLGLAIVRYIVEMHGGTVQASSPGLGRGCTFTISLPVLSAKELPVPAP